MKLEDAGRAIDRELAKVREFVDTKIGPTTRQGLASLLRKTAERLTRIAESLEQPEGGKPAGP